LLVRRPHDVSALRAVARPPWRRAVLLSALLVTALLVMTMQQHAAALRPEFWVPYDVYEWTVG
jgi:hypothetical protein